MINIACFHISYFSIKPPPYNRFFNIVTFLSCICRVFSYPPSLHATRPCAGGGPTRAAALRGRRASRTGGRGCPGIAARGGGDKAAAARRAWAAALPEGWSCCRAPSCRRSCARPHRAWGRALRCLLAAAEILAPRGGGGRPKRAQSRGRGAARRAAPRPAKQKRGAGAKAPGPALSGRFAPCRRPPGPLGSSTVQTIHPPPLSFPAFPQTKLARRSR